MKKYFIDTDDNWYAYLIPVEYRTEWEEWNQLDYDGKKKCPKFPFAERIDIPTSKLEFYLDVKKMLEKILTNFLNISIDVDIKSWKDKYTEALEVIHKNIKEVSIK